MDGYPQWQRVGWGSSRQVLEVRNPLVQWDADSGKVRLGQQGEPVSPRPGKELAGGLQVCLRSP